MKLRSMRAETERALRWQAGDMSHNPGSQLMPVLAAQERLLGMVAPRATTEQLVPLDRARGRVLSRPVIAKWALPGCDNSEMDGFAVRADDCASASPTTPVSLPLAGDARAGAVIGELAPGTVVAVATGAPVPLGADAIVPVEDTGQDGESSVLVFAAPRPGQHVRRAGEDLESGEAMLPLGRRLRPVDIAACAAVGGSSVWVRRRPRVAVLSGGDELVPVGAVPAPHQVTDSNAAMLAAAIDEAGGEVIALGIAGDSPDTLRERLNGTSGCDLIITSGGVSVGRYDYVKQVVGELGAIEAWRLAVRPGKPLLIGRVGDVPMLGLPGNPASAAVTFELFGRPALLALQGATIVHRRRVALRVGQDLETPADLETYLRVRLTDASDGVPVATLSGGQRSSMLRSLADADALLMVPVGVARAPAGAVLTGLELE
ncbi:MAG TPA: molybdopterin molybdenumtransferase MoeA [Chloroflexi bacterium]|jgi:molybdopterin molybdotransferase|nr:molybdopterin molybdenumtransferase MoeA [Chloroflexota bacterium]HBV94486.1 molybdopterin molybdenumtransferase MoeA [Chloroflexota bacterium]